MAPGWAVFPAKGLYGEYTRLGSEPTLVYAALVMPMTVPGAATAASST
jgi:hypothetical protein